MPRIPSSALQRAIMRQRAREAAEREIMRQKALLDAERAIRMRQQHTDNIMNRFGPTDEGIDPIIVLDESRQHGRRFPHYLLNDARRGGYEQRLPYYTGRDAAPRQRTLEYDFDRDYDPYEYEELL